ncbi:MAG: hypothetical protein K6C34_03725 [Alphaproteobacteria bacterium]|nr:hypothetical protein [Alphaproteobacteria bacterium]
MSTTNSYPAQETSHDQIRALYLPADIANDVNRIFEVIRNTDTNAVIIDVKDDLGLLASDLKVPGAKTSSVRNLSKTISVLKKKGIYAIARIVTFKDPERTDLCYKREDGKVWVDRERKKWLNPYLQTTTDYLLDISKRAALLGFDEIQYDYIRFSNTKKGSPMPSYSEIDRRKIINSFLRKATEMLHKLHVKVSVDVFGCIVEGATDSSADLNAAILGQDYVQISKIVDYICPMIYPSHFPNYSMQIPFPDGSPYETVYKFLKLSNKMLQKAKGPHAIVRPYLQAFSATWMKKFVTYTAKEIVAQINATYDSGHQQWALFNFNPNFTYPKLSYEKPEYAVSDIVDKVYVISLDRTLERYSFVSEQLKNANISLKKFSAIDGYTLTFQDVNNKSVIQI